MIVDPDAEFRRVRKPIEKTVNALREYKKHCSRRRAAYVDQLLWWLHGDNGYGGALARLKELERLVKADQQASNEQPQATNEQNIEKSFVSAGFDHGFGMITPIC